MRATVLESLMRTWRFSLLKKQKTLKFHHGGRQMLQPHRLILPKQIYSSHMSNQFVMPSHDPMLLKVQQLQTVPRTLGTWFPLLCRSHRLLRSWASRKGSDTTTDFFKPLVKTLSIPLSTPLSHLGNPPTIPLGVLKPLHTNELAEPIPFFHSIRRFEDR